MKTIFDKNTRDEIISRINSLTPQTQAIWGSMTVTQMLKHVATCEEYYFGKIAVKRSLLGHIIGSMALKGILKNENSALRKNSPTAASFKINDEQLIFEKEKENWKQLIESYATYNKDSFTHFFFGKLTHQQIGQLIYKHDDHHLKQFGV